MTQEPNTRPADGIAALGNMLGRAAHGDRWHEVRAANQSLQVAAIDAAQFAAARKARSERFHDLAGRVCAVIIVLGLLAILSALCVAAWRWAL